MEEKGIFRSAIGGFNKNDVLTYIDRITGEWHQERVQLTETAETARQEADRQIAAAKETAAQAEAAAKEATEAAQAAAKEAVAAAEATVAEAEARLAAMEAQLAHLNEQLAEMTAKCDVAMTEKAALAEELQQEQEKTRTATSEMMAAEGRLQTREQETLSLRQQLDEQQKTIAQYAAVLGETDGMQTHVEGIVRPFMEEANRRSADTLSDVRTLLEAMLAQMAELKTDVEAKQIALQQQKAESDARLTDTVDAWMEKARSSAQDAAGRVTRFFR